MHFRALGDIMNPMTVSAAQADAFYTEVLREGRVWVIHDSGGLPAPRTPDERAAPIWSLRSRANKASNVDAYAAFEAVELPLDEGRTRWLPGLANDGFLVGPNWSGAIATGYDLTPEQVERNLAAREGS